MAGTRAITIHRPPELVWPWLAQQGYGRAGWYSYWVDNRWRPSPDRIVPEWQNLAVGDVVKTDEHGGFTVTEVESGHYWVGLIDEALGRISVVQVVDRGPQQPGQLGGPATTSLVIRIRARFGPQLRARAFWLAFDVGDFLFIRRELRGIKHRAERTPVGGQRSGLTIRDCRGRWSALTHRPCAEVVHTAALARARAAARAAPSVSPQPDHTLSGTARLPGMEGQTTDAAPTECLTQTALG